MISFFLNFEPDLPTKTHQCGLRVGVAKDGKPHLYKDADYLRIESLFDTKLAPFRPSKKMSGPLSLKTIWCFRGKNTEYRTKKPDTDNLVKMLKDRMTKCGFWNDDAQVCKEFIEKIDADEEMRHGVYVKIEPALWNSTK